MNARRFAALVGALALATSLAACSSSSKSGSPKSSVVWPAPSDPMARERAAGLVPETAERLEYHVHAHLDVFVDGASVVVPAGLGIDIDNPGVHQFTTDGRPSYGGIVVPCNQPCISPLHTHDVTGIIHTESPTRKNNTLGQLFTEWDVRLDTNCVATYCKPAKAIAVYVNGTPFTGDPRTIPLSNLTEIAVVVGTPPAQVPSTADWNQI
jgi:hypothetical protein